MTSEKPSKKIPRVDNKNLLPVELNGVRYDFKYDARCRVCAAGEKIVLTVNTMLTQGYSYSSIAKSVQPIIGKPLSYNSIRTHNLNHLPARSAAIRSVIEERSKKMQKDFIEGTANLISPYVYAEIMMKKAFEELVESGTKVTPKEGLEAAKLLNTFIQQEEGQSDVSQAINQLNKIITAVRAIVPPEMFEQIINQIQSNEAPAMITAEAEVIDEPEGEEEFDPIETGANRDDDEF